MSVTKSGAVGRARVIAVGNLKGGTGKSTIAVNLACALAVAGRPSIVIDADPQQTATQWLSRGALPAGVHAAPVQQFAEAPAWIGEIQKIGAAADFVVLDLPAVLGATLAAALLAADLVLVPAAASGPDLSATTRTLHRVARAREERRSGELSVLVVPTRLESGWFRDGGLRRMRIRVPAPFAPPLRKSADYARAFDAGAWVGSLARHSKADRDIRRLARAVLRAIEAGQDARRDSGRALPKVMAAGFIA